MFIETSVTAHSSTMSYPKGHSPQNYRNSEITPYIVAWKTAVTRLIQIVT